MTKTEFIRQVKKKMDELTPFDEGLIISDGMNTNPVFEHIDGVVDECVHEVVLQAPVHLLIAKSFSGDITIANEIANAIMPDDFVKIASVEFPEWERPVFKAISDLDPLYTQQKNKYTRGGSAKPVVVVRTENNKRFIECYTVSSAENAKIRYIGTHAIDQVPDKLLPALEWYVASKVFASMDEPKKAEEANKQYISSLTIRSM